MTKDIQTVLDKLKDLTSALDKVKENGYSDKDQNIFHILKLQTNELAHSAFIAWILSSEYAKISGINVVEKFLGLLYDYIPSKYGEIVNNKTVKSNAEILNYKSKDEFLNSIQVKNHGYKVETEYVIKNKENRIDVLLVFGDTVIVIENKIDTAVHDNQLDRYINEVNSSIYGKYKNKIFVYLSPRAATGELPMNIGGDEEYNDRYCIMDYNAIYELVNAIKVNNKLIRDYKKMLEKDILLNNNDIRAQCKDVRRKYAELLDLIMNYNDNIQDVLEYVKGSFEAKGMRLFSAKKSNGKQVSFDFYSEKLKDFYNYQKDNNGQYVKTNAGYYHCGTDGGNVLCVWHLVPDEVYKNKSQLQKFPKSKKLVTLLTWDERDKEFDKSGNCICDNDKLCKKTIDDRLAECMKNIQEFEKEL
ncbi:MAG: PD-(D/E)XK nuclease family protein [Candidatus Coproplasma sp.]